ncbi:hypothetical protein PybrP1_011077 [[Pythium] brassicae (nom. inval.)]|nr:hypothetical protein PybrP1_011077 [[Pythium] brassicae (nom. inval.)]
MSRRLRDQASISQSLAVRARALLDFFAVRFSRKNADGYKAFAKSTVSSFFRKATNHYLGTSKPLRASCKWRLAKTATSSTGASRLTTTRSQTRLDIAGFGPLQTRNLEQTTKTLLSLSFSIPCLNAAPTRSRFSRISLRSTLDKGDWTRCVVVALAVVTVIQETLWPWLLNHLPEVHRAATLAEDEQIFLLKSPTHITEDAWGSATHSSETPAHTTKNVLCMHAYVNRFLRQTIRLRDSDGVVLFAATAVLHFSEVAAVCPCPLDVRTVSRVLYKLSITTNELNSWLMPLKFEMVMTQTGAIQHQTEAG